VFGGGRRRLLELILRRYERASALLTSNRPVDDWGKLRGDTAAVTRSSTAYFTTAFRIESGSGARSTSTVAGWIWTRDHARVAARGPGSPR